MRDHVVCLTEPQLLVIDFFPRMNRFYPNELEMIRYPVGGPTQTNTIVVKFEDWMPMQIEADGSISY